MSVLKNAYPHIDYNGFRDVSPRSAAAAVETTPQHMPVIPIFSQSGPTNTTVMPSYALGTELFGEQTFATRGKFFNMSTLMLRTALKQGNAVAIKRLIPSDAKPAARVILALDIVKDQVPDSTNPASLDSDLNTPRVAGVRARWVLIKDNSLDVGAQKAVAGSIVATDGTQSKIYPILELPTSFIGSAGNLCGFRLWAPTQNDTPVADLETAEKFKTRMLRIQFMQRTSESASPSVVYTTNSASTTDFCLTEGVYNESTNVEYYGPETLIAKYQDNGKATGSTPVYAPFSELYVYQDNLKEVQTMVQEAITTLTPAAATELSAPDAVNIFTGVDLAGDDYKGFFLEGPIKGGLRLGKDYIVYASGGDDGTLTQAEFEKQYVSWLTTFGKEETYEDFALFPFTCVYDPGLSMTGKQSLISVLGKRKDLVVNLTTWCATDKKGLTVEEELSRSLVLAARIAGYPESTMYNTSVCRATIITQSGYLISSDYSKRVPVLLDYLNKYAKMAGASSGRMSSTAQMDSENNNSVDLICNLNVETFTDSMAKQLWAAGVTYVRASDMRTFYYPAYHSVYADDTSVLTSPITVGIAADTLRVARRAHVHFSGNATLDNNQLQERCNAFLVDAFKDRYTDRVTIVPNTYFTEEDKTNGYSWSTDIQIYANNSPNVMNLNIITDRKTALATNS